MNNKNLPKFSCFVNKIDSEVWRESNISPYKMTAELTEEIDDAQDYLKITMRGQRANKAALHAWLNGNGYNTTLWYPPRWLRFITGPSRIGSACFDPSQYNLQTFPTMFADAKRQVLEKGWDESLAEMEEFGRILFRCIIAYDSYEEAYKELCEAVMKVLPLTEAEFAQHREDLNALMLPENKED